MLFQVGLEVGMVEKDAVSKDFSKQVLESVRRLQAGLQSFLSMRRIEARRKNG